MKAVSGKRLAKLAEEKGWRLARINGSHHIFTMEGRIERLVIPIHGQQTLKTGLQRSLMKLIPVSDEEL
jgi:predicted RNA binding protein YcfA (HicA-like mRNA interferase family)